MNASDDILGSTVKKRESAATADTSVQMSGFCGHVVHGAGLLVVVEAVFFLSLDRSSRSVENNSTYIYILGTAAKPAHNSRRFSVVARPVPCYAEEARRIGGTSINGIFRNDEHCTSNCSSQVGNSRVLYLVYDDMYGLDAGQAFTGNDAH